MVKFSKQFGAQLVPEWKEAFVDYWQLKKDLKKFNFLTSENTNNIQQLSFSPNSLFFSLMKRFILLGKQHARHKAIQVHKKQGNSESKGELYETELLEQFADSEAAVEFFNCLDLQLNKVNQFYRNKEKEFLERGESLKKQMDFLIELKASVRQQQLAKGSSSHHSKEDISISGTISCDEESITDRTEQEQREENNNVQLTDSQRSDELEKQTRGCKKVEGKLKNLSNRVINCQGKNLRLHVPITNPSRTFSAITYLLWDDLVNQNNKKFGSSHGEKLHINGTKLHHAEKMIKGAFIELYKGLGYLKTYRNLNMLAFVKILKKFDKVTILCIDLRKHCCAILHAVPIPGMYPYRVCTHTGYVPESDTLRIRRIFYQVFKLADEVEELFVKHFAEDNKRKAMKYLKPAQRKESHAVTFFIGLFTGCFLALLVGYIIMAHITGMYRPESNVIYMETVYPVLSMFSLLFLHFFLYGCNIFLWRKTRINYTFIFELVPRKELKYRDVFLICTKSMTAVLGVLFLHLFLITKGYISQVQVIPGLLLMVFLVLLVCPFNILYKSSRYRLLSMLKKIILSPLYKVVMLDFFMADQLCSQVPMLRNLEYVACYYITGSYKTQDYGLCMRNKNYRDLAYAVSFLPYYWRAMQCARRWFDEGHTSQLVNLGKYVSAMLAAGAKVAYEKEKSIEWLCLLVIVSSFATVYQLYWDFVKDWGLLQFNSKNPWLRDELMLRKKFIYYLSMGLNLVLRLAWLQTVVHYNFGNIDYRVTGLFLAALEIVRRGQWNFYRLENEHLNNAGKYRAVKIVPLPFHEVGDED